MPSFDEIISFIKKYASKLTFTRDLVALYYCMIDPEVPGWAKALIITTILYVLNPFDLIPDMIPGGLVDDAGMVVTTIATLAGVLNARHYELADNYLYG